MLDLPLGVVSRVERIGSASSRGDVSFGLVCKVSQQWNWSGIITVVWRLGFNTRGCVTLSVNPILSPL